MPKIEIKLVNFQLNLGTIGIGIKYPFKLKRIGHEEDISDSGACFYFFAHNNTFKLFKKLTSQK